MKKIMITIIGVLLVFNIWMLYNKNKEVKSIKDIQTKIEAAYENTFIVEQQNNKLKLNQNISFLTVDGDSIFIKDVFKSEKIVFRYSFLNCGACISAELDVLAQFNKAILDKLIIIAHYDNIRGMISITRKLKKLGLDGVPVYLIKNNKLGIPMDKQNLPYYFTIDSDLRMNNFFLPLKEQPKLSFFYLKYSIENYFD